MKFSVLIPTRNRLELLRYAVESVRMQSHEDWEIVVSDNASSVDVNGYVESLHEPRIRYIRTEKLVPVTDNWNLALEQSTGDYLIMLGDDDALLANCLADAHKLVERWGKPDAIYTQALQFAYPGVVPGHAQAFVQTGYTEFFTGEATEPFQLPRAAAEALVRQAMRFRIRYGFNMQHFIFSRTLVTALERKGAFFQSPYPDYYAANAILLAARSIVANPRALVLIGISPKSFGFYFQNRREGEGVAFLQNLPSAEARARLRDKFVPGSNMNDSWLCAMEALAANFPEHQGLCVSHRRYRLLQYQATLREHSWRGLRVVLGHVRWWELLIYAPIIAAYALAFLLPRRARAAVQNALKATLSAYPRFDLRRRAVPYRNILEAARAVST